MNESVSADAVVMGTNRQELYSHENVLVRPLTLRGFYLNDDVGEILEMDDSGGVDRSARLVSVGHNRQNRMFLNT